MILKKSFLQCTCRNLKSNECLVEFIWKMFSFFQNVIVMEIKDLSLGIVQGVTPLLTLVFNLHLNLHFSTLMLLSPSFHLLISPQTCFLSSRLDLFPHVCWLFCYLITCIITFNYSFCLQFRHLNNW